MRGGLDAVRHVPIYIDAQNAGEKVFVDELAVETGVVAVAFIADGNIEVAVVRTEMNIPAVVVARLIELLDEDALARDIRSVRIRCLGGEA